MSSTGRPTAFAAVAVLAAVALAGVAMPAAADEPARIPFDAILENPDDLELTVSYARQELAAGNLPAASAALERLLILYPNENTVRLLYAVTLFRLDQVAEAEREFAAVDPAQLSAADRGAFDEYRERTRRRLSRLTGELGITVGIQYDTNRDNFPIGGTFQVEIPGLGPSVIDSDEDGEDDFGLFGVVSGRVDYKPPSQRLQRLSLEFTALGIEQFDLDEFDVVSGYVAGSAFIDATVVDVEPRVVYRQIQLGGDRYLRSGEGALRIQRAIGNNQRLLGFAEFAGGYDDFAPVEADDFADEKSGPFVLGRIGAVWTPTDRFGLIASYNYTERFADEGFEAFTSHGVGVTAQYVLTDATALRASVTYAYADFDDPDPFISTTVAQEDHAIGTRLGLVVRADALLEGAGIEDPVDAAKNLSLNLGFGYRRVFSNLDNFDYQNFRFDASITKRFLF